MVSEQATRDQAALLADRERLRQADQLTPDRRARLLDLQLDGIREAPVGIVVACDRRAPAAGVLGRASFADADLWSCACAMENMWLTARAAGLGLGWVTLFQPADLAELLDLPDGVETLGLAVPGLAGRAAARSRPGTAGLVAAAAAGRRDRVRAVAVRRTSETGLAPGRRPCRTLAGPDQRAVVAGRDTGDDRLTVPGSLGVLDAAVNRVLALAPDPPSGRDADRRGGRPPGHPVRGLRLPRHRSPPMSCRPPGSGSRSARRPRGRPDCGSRRCTPAPPARRATWSRRTR